MVLASIGWQPTWWSILQSTFMRHAFIGGTLLAVAAGMIGYFVVIRQSAFAAHALAHVGFPGATGAVLVGAPVIVGLAVFTIGGGLVIGALGRRAATREVATGTILALATALGILFSSMASQNTRGLTNILFGNLLVISTPQLVVYSAFTAAIVVVLGFVARPLLFASIDPTVAAARGVPVGALGTVFLVLMALVVTMAVQVVGTLLLFALVVTPAAAALRITARPLHVVGLATSIGTGSVWLGLVLSAMFNLPPSFAIVTLAVAVWGGVLAATGDRHRAAAANIGHDGHHPHEATHGHGH